MFKRQGLRLRVYRGLAGLVVAMFVLDLAVFVSHGSYD